MDNHFIFLLFILLLVSGCTTTLEKEQMVGDTDYQIDESEKNREEDVANKLPGEKARDEQQKLIVSNPLNLSQIASISKFRSCIGHDYSGVNSEGEKETLRSMKHYVSPLPELIGSDRIKIFAPFDGTVSEITESPPGKQIFISSSTDRRWNFIFFHIVPNLELQTGTEVVAGQLIGYASPEIQENFDIGLKQLGFRQVFESPFVHMSESVMKEYLLRGLTLENVIISKGERDSSPCPIEGTSNGDARFKGHSNEDFVLLTQQKIGTEQKEIEHREIPPSNQAVFHLDGKAIFEHYWPLDPLAPHLKADESEMVVYNDGDTNLQITSTDMKFLLDGKIYSQYSGTWEKFSSRTSWEKLEYINIKPNYYKNEPLILQPGQKAKIHYHYKFGIDIAGKKQAVQINLKYKLNNLEKNLDRRLERTRELYYSEGNSGESH